MKKSKRSKVQVGSKGGVTIPAHIRKELDIQPGQELLVRVDDGRIVLEASAHMLKRWQKKFQDAAGGVSLVDELIAERREEARREAAESEF